MLNIKLNKFKLIHQKKKNQVLFLKVKTNGKEEILNLINNFLKERNSFVFESVEKGKIRGRYTIFGKSPDKIWEFNDNNCYIYRNNKKLKLKGLPKDNLEKILENFKFKIPKGLPPICSLISGYFSYDIIRYAEKIPNNCKNDLDLPDTRIMRPRILIIHDNYKKELFYIYNLFSDEKVKNYSKKYKEILNQLEYNIFLSNFDIKKK